MPKKLAWLRKLLLYLVIFAGASLIANAWITRDHITGVAPTLPLDQRIYQRNHPAEISSSGPMLVYFYASWCPVCKVDMPAIESVAGSYPVIAVAMQSGNDDEVLAHRAEQGFDLDIINDEHGELARAFRVRGVPTAFIIDDGGEIRFSTQGFSAGIGYWVRMLWTDWF